MTKITKKEHSKSSALENVLGYSGIAGIVAAPLLAITSLPASAALAAFTGAAAIYSFGTALDVREKDNTLGFVAALKKNALLKTFAATATGAVLYLAIAGHDAPQTTKTEAAAKAEATTQSIRGGASLPVLKAQ
ncbi:hypothetical protein [Micavibrio aeruginosavorus]|uniref:Uncharacterized protein n=1 Tax=Micavibrio aeruginosavorus EPB TaxID=349215 RepID=M4W179_9BACT|nr:hypothetical protein [Micavibrio aeruginosavorus]AGH99199.1 hypothetical protein A11S_2405 [Micavibrio aeruginosavorus EPB]